MPIALAGFLNDRLQVQGGDTFLQAFAKFVFVLFEPEKFKSAQTETTQKQMPRCEAWVSFLFVFVQVSQDLKSETAAKDTPLSFQ